MEQLEHRRKEFGEEATGKKEAMFSEKRYDKVSQVSETNQGENRYRIRIVWINVAYMSFFHIGALIGIRECIYSAQWKTIVFAYFLYVFSGIGITAGAHRLWSHRGYKATWELRFLLAFFNTIAFQNSIYEWTRDHRVHHKYCETDADPHNSKRGFFFSHVGWLLCRKHPDVSAKGKTLDMSDLEADPIVRFQHRHYFKLIMLCCFILPTVIPYLAWGETLYNSYFICALLRYVFLLHWTWLVNSAAHMFGRKPYDKSINAAENRFVSFGALGEGFHNYHHVYPWDYAASELRYDLNLTKLFIDFFSLFGWAYDRKIASTETIEQRMLRTGDVHEKGDYGSYRSAQNL